MTKFTGLLTEEEVEIFDTLEKLMRKKGWRLTSVFQCQDGDYQVLLHDVATNLEGLGKEGTVPQAVIEAMEDIIYQEAEIRTE